MPKPNPRSQPARAAAADPATTLQRATVLVAFAGSALLFLTRALSPFSTVKTAVVFVAAVVVGAAALYKVVADGVLPVPRWLPALGFGLFGAGLVVALLVADTPGLALFGAYKRHSGVLNYASYLTMGVVTARTFDTVWLRRLLWTVGGTAIAVAVFGVLAWAGAGPETQAAPGVIGITSTLGNPNFASAAVALGAAPAAWALFVARTRRDRVWLWIATVVLVAVMVFTFSAQGPIAAVAGASVVVLAWALNRGGKAARLATPVWAGGSALAALVVGLGLANVGPLAVLGAQRSFELRRWYWDAAVDMLRSAPLTGVGMDHYGQYYRQFRPLAAALDTALEQGNDAAHSVPLGMFASGGLLLGLGYLALVVVTAVFLVGALRRTEGERRLLVAAVGGAWLAYQVQSLVSIDVPSLALAHFVLAGAVLAVSGRPVFAELRLPWAGTRRRRSASTRQRVAAAVAVVAGLVGAFFAVVPLRADLAAGRGARLVEQDPLAGAAGLQRATEIAGWEATYWLEHGFAMIAAQQAEQALASLSEAAERDPADLSALVTRARVAAQFATPQEALADYERALRVEPQHPALKLEAARFALEHDPDRARALLTDVLAIDPANAEAQQLLAQLPG